MLAELKESLSARGLEIVWDNDLPGALVKKAYSVVYGARNLRRTIQKELEDPISQLIIDSFQAPISTITVKTQDDEICVSAK